MDEDLMVSKMSEIQVPGRWGLKGRVIEGMEYTWEWKDTVIGLPMRGDWVVDIDVTIPSRGWRRWIVKKNEREREIRGEKSAGCCRSEYKERGDNVAGFW
jgi:hypothetical protein